MVLARTRTLALTQMVLARTQPETRSGEPQQTNIFCMGIKKTHAHIHTRTHTKYICSLPPAFVPGARREYLYHIHFKLEQVCPLDPTAGTVHQ